MIVKKLVALAAGLALTATMSACSSSRETAGTSTAAAGTGAATAAAAGGKIGVAMPTKQSERWIADGNNVK